jgi:hypothetical protein
VPTIDFLEDPPPPPGQAEAVDEAVDDPGRGVVVTDGSLGIGSLLDR